MERTARTGCSQRSTVRPSQYNRRRCRACNRLVRRGCHEGIWSTTSALRHRNRARGNHRHFVRQSRIGARTGRRLRHGRGDHPAPSRTLSGVRCIAGRPCVLRARIQPKPARAGRPRSLESGGSRKQRPAHRHDPRRPETRCRTAAARLGSRLGSIRVSTRARLTARRCR
jgi:hypothetical protein